MLALLVACAALLASASAASALPGDPCFPDCGGTLEVTLHIQVIGTGAVKQGTTTLCSTDCDIIYAEGSAPTLSAAPGSGLDFAGWGGDCSGTGDCSPDMTVDRSITATFADLTPPPAPTISSPSAGQVIQSTTGGAVWVNFSAAGATEYLCRVDDRVFTTCNSGGWSTGSLSTAAHTVDVRARDAANNLSTISSRTFKVVNLPDTGLSGTPAASSITTSVTTAFSYSSATGTSYSCKLDGNPIACAADVGPLVDGTHTFTVAAGIAPFDSTVYFDTTPASRTWTVDTVAPTTAIAGGPDGSATTATAADFRFTVTDAAPGTATVAECSLDGAAFGGCPGPAADQAAYSGLAVGSHTFKVRGRDAAGNTGTATERTWTVIADADGDGFFTTSDCNDGNAAVHPGASDIAGNGVDEDCSGADAAAAGASSPTGGSTSGGSAPGAVLPRIRARLTARWSSSRAGSRAKLLRLTKVPAGAKIALRCKGRGCPFKKKSAKPSRGRADLAKLLKKRRLRRGVILEIRISKPGMATQALRVTIRAPKKPKLSAI